MKSPRLGGGFHKAYIHSVEDSDTVDDIVAKILIFVDCNKPLNSKTALIEAIKESIGSLNIVIKPGVLSQFLAVSETAAMLTVTNTQAVEFENIFRKVTVLIKNSLVGQDVSLTWF